MKTDLLQLKDHEPPMGDLAVNPLLSEPRALWTRPLGDEPASPERRIIHSRTVRLHSSARLYRLGLRKAMGYHNCGSRTDLDWVTAVRVLAWQEGKWNELLSLRDLPSPADGEINWHDLGGVSAGGVLIELRGSGIDFGWTPWALAQAACILEGELSTSLAPRCQRALDLHSIEIEDLPEGLTAELRNGSVIYRTPDFTVGFFLQRPGLSHFSPASEDPALLDTNTLHLPAGMFLQGPRLHLIGREPAIDPFTRFDAKGNTTVKGGTVTYKFTAHGQHYTLVWSISPDGLRLCASRQAAHDVHAWISTPWRVTLQNSITPTHAIGRITPHGETGLMELPIAVNFPRFGTWKISADSPGALVRFDAWRPYDYNTLELKLGEQILQNGTYLLPAGTHTANFEFTPLTPPRLLREDAPAEAKAALKRVYHTALTYRPEMGTLSNNGASTPCAISMDTWASFIFKLGEPLPGFPAHELLRSSLERWLAGGQSYADGRIIRDGRMHEAQDEYIMTGTAALLGLAEYLEYAAGDGWFHRQLPHIRERLAAMKIRDLDADGLVESPWRTGLSGTGQWSTCWLDVISFGWKDAFANAILHPALRGISRAFARHGLDKESAELLSWADRLKASYLPTFFNEETGWIAGWRCKEDRLHDYAFLVVNGCAINADLVPERLARTICSRLLSEAAKVGMPDAVYGLPPNLHPIPDEDLATIAQGFPFGFYQNGGRTHAQARHFVMALYRTGFTAEADQLLSRMCTGYAEARTFGGSKSGIDWRYWDDRPCGYEGLLTDQFGMLEAILHRYGAPPVVTG